MAFLATNQALSAAYSEIKRAALVVRNRAQSLRANLASGSVASSAILTFVADLRSAKLRLAELSATAGLAEYAAEQEADPSYDVTAEYMAMVSAIDAAILWIATNIPQSGGYLQTETLNADGSITYREFAPAATAGLVAELDALIAAIA